MTRRSMHEVILQHGPLVRTRRLHGVGVARVLATVKLARVVELLVAGTSDSEVLLVVNILRRSYGRVSGLLRLDSRHVLFASAQDRRD